MELYGKSSNPTLAATWQRPPPQAKQKDERKMKPKTWYQIAALTSAGHTEYCLPQTNWSQYGERFARHTAEWKKSYDKNPDKKSHWPKWDVYGLPQAREHLAELKAKEPGRNFVIIKTTEKMIE